MINLSDEIPEVLNIYMCWLYFKNFPIVRTQGEQPVGQEFVDLADVTFWAKSRNPPLGAYLLTCGESCKQDKGEVIDGNHAECLRTRSAQAASG